MSPPLFLYPGVRPRVESPNVHTSAALQHIKNMAIVPPYHRLALKSDNDHNGHAKNQRFLIKDLRD